MPEPEKPIPDGKIRILHMSSTVGSTPAPWWETVPFADSEGSTNFRHRPEVYGLLLCWDEHRREIPWGQILEVDVIYNGQEYHEQLTQYKELIHQQHIIDDADVEDCPHCIMTRLGQQFIDNAQIIEMPNDPDMRRRQEGM
jgi:hypothetical protein